MTSDRPLVSKLPSRRQVSSQVCLCGKLSLSAWSDAAQPGNLGTRVRMARLRETVKPAEPRGRRGRTAPPHPGGHCGPAGSPLAPACAAPFATPPTPALLTPAWALREAWLPLGSAFSLPHLPGLLGTLAAVFPPCVEAPPSDSHSPGACPSAPALGDHTPALPLRPAAQARGAVFTSLGSTCLSKSISAILRLPLHSQLSALEDLPWLGPPTGPSKPSIGAFLVIRHSGAGLTLSSLPFVFKKILWEFPSWRSG